METFKNNLPAASDKKNQASQKPDQSKVDMIVEIIEYIPHAIVSKTVIIRTAGNVTVSAVAAGEELDEKKSPYDTDIQIIDGAAELFFDENLYILKAGNGMLIPADTTYRVHANEKFKMISTVIKKKNNDWVPGWGKTNTLNINTTKIPGKNMRFSNVHANEQYYKRGSSGQQVSKK